MKKNAPQPTWHPSYPEPKDRQVEMVHCTTQTYISDRRPVITISDHPFENPACFWIDPSHIYARLNWREWCAVEPSSPNVAAAICASHHCQMSQFQDNELKDMSAPVYHVAELPPELFLPVTRERFSEETFAERKRKAISSLVDIIPDDMDAMGFRHVSLEGFIVDLVVSSDDLAVLFAVYPEDADCSAAQPGTGRKNMESEPLEIPSTVLDELVRYRAILGKLEPHAELHAAIIAGSDTLESMRNHWASELEEKRIELVEYPDFVEYLQAHFPTCDDEDGDGEE